MLRLNTALDDLLEIVPDHLKFSNAPRTANNTDRGWQAMQANLFQSRYATRPILSGSLLATCIIGYLNWHLTGFYIFAPYCWDPFFLRRSKVETLIRFLRISWAMPDLSNKSSSGFARYVSQQSTSLPLISREILMLCTGALAGIQSTVSYTRLFFPKVNATAQM
jgi:hypothetical protein